MNSLEKGNLSHTAVELELQKLGAYVATFKGDGAKVDLIFTWDFEKEYKVQVKTAFETHRGEGAMWVKGIGSSVKDKKIITYNYVGIVHFIAAYYPRLDQCYLIPIDKIGKRGITLRYDPPKKRRTKGINWAKDFELKKIAAPLRP